MAELTVVSLVKTGLEPSYAAVNASDVFDNPSDERTFLHVKNGDGSPTNVTFTAQRTAANVPGAGQVTLSDLVVSVPAGEERMIGPFAGMYNDADGQVTVSYSNTTSITAQAIRMPADSF